MIKKIFLTFFAVQLATYVTTIIGITVDGLVTGSLLGTESLAAYGLVNPFLTVLTAIASAISVGTSTLVSSRLGKGDLKEMNRAFNVCFWATAVLSVAIAAAVFVFAGPIASALKAEGTVHGLAVQYLHGYSIGFVFIFPVTLSIPILQLIGKRTTLVFAIVSMTAVNIAMDFFNALVWHKEMLGMALATTFSYLVAFIIVLTALVTKDGMLRLARVPRDSAIIREMTGYGAPNAVSMGCRNLLTIVINHMILTIASIQMIAGYTAIMSAMALAMSIGIALAATVAMLTGVFAGEKDRHGLVDMMGLSVRYSIIFCGICSAVFIIFAGPIISLFFKGDVSVFDDAVLGLRIVVLSAILFSVNFCVRSYYQAMKIRIAIPYAVFNCLISTVAIAFVLSRIMGVMGIWLAYPLGELLTLIVFGAYALRKTSGSGHNIRERLMLIPDDYYSDTEPLEIPVSSLDEAVHASEQVGRYMEENGSAKKTAMFAALAVEELAGNVILHGFNDGKPHMLLVSLKKDDDAWILRTRDNCRQFDPEAYVKGITSAEDSSHYGIRMIYGLADEVKYLNTLNLNNLIVRFTDQPA